MDWCWRSRENGESPEECLLREVKEETGLTLTSYRFRALITFISDKQEPELMCLFTADEFSGKLITMQRRWPQWVDKTIVAHTSYLGRRRYLLKAPSLKMKKISSHLSLYMKVNHWLIRSLRFISIILPQGYLQASAYLPPSFFPCYNKHSHIFPGIWGSRLEQMNYRYCDFVLNHSVNQNISWLFLSAARLVGIIHISNYQIYTELLLILLCF